MKQVFMTLAAVALLLSVAACGGSNAKKTDAQDAAHVAQVDGADTLAIDLTQSTINWKGFKPGGQHHGTIALKGAEVYLLDKQVQGGFAEIDMKSIVVGDLEGESAQQLKGHLESADFFEVETYPTARFEITGVENISTDSLMLSGNLTMKDVTKNISFKAKVSEQEGVYRLSSEPFTIDRIVWNVQYGSKNIFKNLGDKFINDEMELQISLQTQ